MHFKKISISLLIAVFLVSCTTTAIDKPDSKNPEKFSNISSLIPSWNFQNLETKNYNENYFSTFDFYLEEEQTLCHAVKIDLSNPQLSISIYPDNSELKSTTASSLAKNNDIVINTTPWSQKIPLISKKIPAGIIYADGTTYSKANKNYDAICFYKTQKTDAISSDSSKTNYRAAIIAPQTEIKLTSNNFLPPNDPNSTTLFAIGGFWQILKDGEKLSFKEICDSRTAIGISKDQKTLYILIVEGEQKSRSKGLTYGQCSEIFTKFGAFNAIELDGGSSTTLYIHNKNVLSYKKNPKLPAFLCFSKVLFDK